ncbi:TGB2 [Cassava Colombian symptomless virus]|uniref:TGB2 n=1 Tax=Cassava Colombian symptomless virus TaxID=2843917 RepID=V9PRK1_9VIRU|nr:TGB2 [Cassava Colombian symptomless virus]AHA91821.1 TGB2 [Cassava Colombian symptomless virus]
MPLVPPPDPNKTYQVGIVAAAICAFCYIFVSDNRSFTGDRENAFPNGGSLSYCKTANFNRPSGIRFHSSSHFHVLLLIFSLILAIKLFGQRSVHCPTCRG